MLRALSYQSNSELPVTEYRSLKRDQENFQAYYQTEEEARMAATLASFSKKLLIRTSLVFLFFVSAFFLQHYQLLG